MYYNTSGRCCESRHAATLDEVGSFRIIGSAESWRVVVSRHEFLNHLPAYMATKGENGGSLVAREGARLAEARYVLSTEPLRLKGSVVVQATEREDIVCWKPEDVAFLHFSYGGGQSRLILGHFHYVLNGLSL